MHPQHWMEEAFGSPSRVRILRLLSQEPTRVWTGREIARRIGMSPNTVSSSLTRLRQAGLLEFRAIGASHAVRLRQDLVVSATLQEAFQMEAALLRRMKEAISSAIAPGTACYLFGSTARGDAHRESDVDLLVVAKTKNKAEEEAHRVFLAARNVVPTRVRVLPMSAAEYRAHRDQPAYRDIPKAGERLSDTPLEAFA